MKFYFTVATFLFTFLLSALSNAYAFSDVSNSNSCPIDSKAVNGGDGGDFTPWPIPWGLEVTMNTNGIKGVWAPTSVACDSYFLFTVSTKTINNHKERFLKVTQFNSETCEVLSSGIGYENNHVFIASMVTPDNQFFDLTLRGFKTSDLEKNTSNPNQPPPNQGNNQDSSDDSDSRKKPVMILSLFPQKQWDKKMSYQIIHISDSTQYKCENGKQLSHRK